MRINRCPRCQERFELFEARSRWLQTLYAFAFRRCVRCWRCGKLFAVPRRGTVLEND